MSLFDRKTTDENSDVSRHLGDNKTDNNTVTRDVQDNVPTDRDVTQQPVPDTEVSNRDVGPAHVSDRSVGASTGDEDNLAQAQTDTVVDDDVTIETDGSVTFDTIPWPGY